MWQDRRFTCIVIFLLTLYHHNHGLGHSIIASKPVKVHTRSPHEIKRDVSN